MAMRSGATDGRSASDATAGRSVNGEGSRPGRQPVSAEREKSAKIQSEIGGHLGNLGLTLL